MTASQHTGQCEVNLAAFTKNNLANAVGGELQAVPNLGGVRCAVHEKFRKFEK